MAELTNSGIARVELLSAHREASEIAHNVACALAFPDAAEMGIEYLDSADVALHRLIARLAFARQSTEARCKDAAHA